MVSVTIREIRGKNDLSAFLSVPPRCLVVGSMDQIAGNAATRVCLIIQSPPPIRQRHF